MEIHFKIIGILSISIALIHIGFPKYFNWKQELNSLSLINRQMIYVHTFFISVVVLLTGLLCITSTTELLQSSLGKTICLGLAIFWSARLIIQIFGFSSKLWRGKSLETSVHILFSIFWIYFSTIFILAYLKQ